MATRESWWHAGLAVDGNTNNIFGYHSCSRTLYGGSPWWMVDLLHEYDIKEVVIYHPLEFQGQMQKIEVTTGQSEDEANFFGSYDKVVRSREEIRIEKDNGEVATKVRYVRIEAKATTHLNLCEVKVYGKRSDNSEDAVDISTGRLASQSSTDSNGWASSAVDGRNGALWGWYTCSRTHYTSKPWWEVNLGKLFEIERVVVYNRYGEHRRLNNYDVSVRDADKKFVPCSELTGYATPQEILVHKCHAVGDKVQIQLRGTEMLSMCEVRVYGRSVHGTIPEVKISSIAGTA
jgi:hypothetical protein